MEHIYFLSARKLFIIQGYLSNTACSN